MSSDIVKKAIANLISEGWDAEAEAVRQRIEALEGEVADSLPWKLFYKDGLDLKQIGGRLNVDPYSLSPWLYAPLLKQDGHPYQAALKAAEARAERLRVFVAHVAKQQTVEEMGDEATFADFEGGWTSIVLDARKALGDDKP